MSTYTSHVIPARKALVEKLIASRGARSDWAWRNSHELRVAEALCQRIGSRLFSLAENGQSYSQVWADDEDAALEVARDNFDADNYAGDDETGWVEIQAWDCITGDHISDTVTVEAAEPECAEGQDHDWRSPFGVVGGIKENPGVWGHGGGVLIKEVCSHCGAYRLTDTWAQRPDTGEQGLRAVSYATADDRSLAWIAD